MKPNNAIAMNDNDKYSIGRGLKMLMATFAYTIWLMLLPLLVVLLAGCGETFPTFNEVDRFRVLSVKADPPALALGEVRKLPEISPAAQPPLDGGRLGGPGGHRLGHGWTRHGGPERHYLRRHRLGAPAGAPRLLPLPLLAIREPRSPRRGGHRRVIRSQGAASFGGGPFLCPNVP